jgi:sec-independent protein translocase protein TatC
VDDPDEEGLGGRMGFLAHLDEFRSRLIRCCVAIVVGMLVAVAFVGRIADFVLAPTMRVLPPGTNLIMTRPGEGLSFYLDLALIAGVLIATPYISFQVWRFIAPGLYAREKRMALPFIGLAIFGTVGGALFSHYALFPSMMAFFGTFDSPRMRFTPRLEDTFELYKNMLLAMVGVFQIPTLVFFLARMGLVTARFLWRHISYAVLISFIVAAALTPTPDPWNQTAFALPMVGLYIISIGVAWLVAPKRRPDTTRGGMKRGLKLVFAAAVVDQVARRRHRTPGTFPRKV